MKRKACLIFNASAGQSDPVEDLIKIRNILEPVIDLNICPTSKEVGATDLAYTAISKGAEILIVAGGDGTISSVVETLIGTGIPLGIIPRGTVNAFAKALSIPIEITAACKTILSQKLRVVDTAICNKKPMIVLTGIGLEAEIIAQTDRKIKNNFGILAFILAGINELGKLKAFETWVETENQVIHLSSVAVTIANAAAPTSLLAHGPAGVIVDDGLLEVTLFAPTNKTNAFFAAYHLLRSGFTGTATNRDDIKYLRSKYVKVRTEPPQKVTLDGDAIEATTVKITCIPKALTVFVPT
jgi:YegS/Rv2252/BmrU family lipid kinase